MDEGRQPASSNSPHDPERLAQEGPASGLVSPSIQRRNQVCYLIMTSLLYLAGPLLYMDVIPPILLEKLGASRTVCNLPPAVGGWLAPLPLVTAWLVPYMRWVRPVIVGCWALGALATGSVALAIISPISSRMKIAAIVLHAAVYGAAQGVAGVFTWEVLSKGMSEEARGKLFSITFLIGPGFAVLGSWAAQKLLGSSISWEHEFHDFAVVYGLVALVMLLIAFVASGYHVSIPPGVEQRQLFFPFVFGGLWDYVRQRRFYMLIITYVVCQAAWYCYTNASLNVRDALGIEPKSVAGTIQALRFGGKMIAGLLLGLLVARRGAKAGAVATTVITALAVLSLFGFKGERYLFAFALFGAGELAGLYYPNYNVSASRPQFVKRNASLFALVGLLIGFLPTGHGRLADNWGFQTSFKAALIAGLVAILLVLALPHLPPAKARAASDADLTDRPDAENEGDQVQSAPSAAEQEG